VVISMFISGPSSYLEYSHFGYLSFIS
jgi:hypothetical protein